MSILKLIAELKTIVLIWIQRNYLVEAGVIAVCIYIFILNLITFGMTNSCLVGKDVLVLFLSEGKDCEGFCIIKVSKYSGTTYA